jgi:D-threo-aldose 1-dehydrogenase
MIFPSTENGMRLGLGGAPLGNLYRALDEAEAQAVFGAALADGCNTFDTAPHYGNGLSELRFGQALRGLPRGRLHVSSKVGRLLAPDQNAAPEQNGFVNVLPFTQRWDYSAQGVRRSLHESLLRLGLARLDTVFIHDCDMLNHGARYPQVLHQVLVEALPELHHMRGEGLLHHIGLGVNDVQVCLDVLRGQNHGAGIDCLLLAGRYTLLDQTALPELLALCLERGLRVALGGVFNSGILATGVLGAKGADDRSSESAAPMFNYAAAPREWVARAAAIETLCQQFDVPLRAAALQFSLAHPAVDVVLAGAQTAQQWQDTMAMLRQPIDDGFWRALRGQGLVMAQAPLPKQVGAGARP